MKIEVSEVLVETLRGHFFPFLTQYLFLRRAQNVSQVASSSTDVERLVDLRHFDGRLGVGDDVVDHRPCEVVAVSIELLILNCSVVLSS